MGKFYCCLESQNSAKGCFKLEVSIARRQPVPKIKPISYDIEFNYPSPRGLIVSPAFCRHDRVDLVQSEKGVVKML
jgi:hypothetical protein